MGLHPLGPDADKTKLVVRYVVVGAMGACFYASLYCGLVALNAGKSVLASLIAYACAVVFQYFTHARLTFRVRSNDRSQMVKFLAVTAAGFTISSLIAYVGPRLGIPPIGVAAIVVVVIPVFNLAAFSGWVFKAGSPQSAAAQPAPLD